MSDPVFPCPLTGMLRDHVTLEHGAPKHGYT